MSLSVGLAIGLGAAGATAGGLGAIFGNVGGAVVEAFSRGMVKTKEASVAGCVVIGGLSGGAFGYAAGEGYEYLTSDSPDQPAAIIQACYDNVPEGKKVVIAKDDIGNPICSFE